MSRQVASRPPDASDPERDAEVLATAERRLRVLHELRPEARLWPDLESPYVGFLRMLREQLHPRGRRDVRTVRVPPDLTFRVDAGDRLGCDVLYGYYEERFEASLFAAALRPGGVMADAGANFGYYAVTGARAAGPDGAVYAFEPDPAAYELLAANARLNGVEATLLSHPICIGAEDGETAFHLADEPAFSGIASTGRSGLRGVVTVPMRSLDSLLGEAGHATLDALKIDVEGFEGDVLRGARETLRRSPDPLVMLEVSAKNLSDAARASLLHELRRLSADGYTGLVLDPSPSGWRPVPTADEAASLPSANLFLVRAGGPREAWLRAAVGNAMPRGPLLSVGGDETDDRPVRMYTGVDPAYVVAAFRERPELDARIRALDVHVRELEGEVAKLRAERAALRAQVRRLSATPLGLAYRAARRVARSLAERRP